MNEKLLVPSASLLALGCPEGDNSLQRRSLQGAKIDQIPPILANAPLVIATKTLHFKVREECCSWLDKAAREVNTVWNFSNELHYKAYNNYFGKRKWMSSFDLNHYVAGCGEVFNYIGIDIAQCVNAEFARRCNQFKRSKLKFRKSFTPRKTLGWIPFKTANLRLNERSEIKHKTLKKRVNENSKDFKARQNIWQERLEKGCAKKTTHSLSFMGKTIRIHNFDRYLQAHTSGKPRQGNFSQNSTGEWFLNQTFDVYMLSLPALGGEKSYVGIDPGCKTPAVAVGFDQYGKRHVHVLDCSFLKPYEEKLKRLQRNGHLEQAKLLHQKIKNKRNNAIHLFTKELINNYQNIYFGNAEILPKKNSRINKKAKKLQELNQEKLNQKETNRENSNTQIKNNLTSKHTKRKPRFFKSRLDASWGKQKAFLSYKGHWASRNIIEVDERFTSVMCSTCKAHTGPKGLKSLHVRKWVCSGCNTEHGRDENSAKNMPYALPVKEKASSFVLRQQHPFALPSKEVKKREQEQLTLVG